MKGLFGSILLCLLACALASEANGINTEEEHCRSDIQSMLSPAQNGITDVVLKMRQATGKGTWANTPLGSKFDMGNWVMCEELEPTHYCGIYSVRGENQRFAPAVGACVPNTCSAKYLEGIPRATLVAALGLPFSPVGGELGVECFDRVGVEEMPWAGYLLCAVLTMIMAAVVVATVVDCQTRYDVLPLARTVGPKASRADLYDTRMVEEEADEGLVDRNTLEFSGIYGKSSMVEPSAEEMSYLASDEDVAGIPQNDVSDTYRAMRAAPWFEPLMAFSAARNTGKLLTPPPVTNTSALNGIRVLSMLWVIMGHTWFFTMMLPLLNFSSVATATETLRFQLLYGGFFAVDSFFVMSGFLVAYLLLLELKKKGMQRITMPLFYFHRLWRLWPTIAVGTLFYWLVSPYVWTTGPSQPMIQTAVDNVCDDWWWTPLVFITNVVSADHQCAGWLWYLANDMQFYILSPIIIIAYWKFKPAGVGIAVLGIMVCILSNMLTAIVYDLDAFPFLNYRTDDDFEFNEHRADHQVLSNVYMLPWTRCAAYLCGMLTAFALVEKSTLRVLMHNAVRYTALILSACVLFILTFVTYTAANWGWTKFESMIWLGFSRTSWGLALGVWIFYLSCGQVGAVNRIFSHSVWVPLARLSFGCYMYHLVFITNFYYSFKAPLQYQTDIMVCLYVFNVIGAYAFAYINYLLVEKPMMNIEKMLLGKLKR